MLKIPGKKSKFNFLQSGLPKPKPKQKGASLFQQKRWAMMKPSQKSFNRMLLPDRDGDKVPDYFDCQPFNPKKQEVFRVRRRKLPRNVSGRSLVINDPARLSRALKTTIENVTRNKPIPKEVREEFIKSLPLDKQGKKFFREADDRTLGWQMDEFEREEFSKVFTPEERSGEREVGTPYNIIMNKDRFAKGNNILQGPGVKQKDVKKEFNIFLKHEAIHPLFKKFNKKYYGDIVPTRDQEVESYSSAVEKVMEKENDKKFKKSLEVAKKEEEIVSGHYLNNLMEDANEEFQIRMATATPELIYNDDGDDDPFSQVKEATKKKGVRAFHTSPGGDYNLYTKDELKNPEAVPETLQELDNDNPIIPDELEEE